MTSVFILNSDSVALRWGSRCLREDHRNARRCRHYEELQAQGVVSTGHSRGAAWRGLDTSKRGCWASLVVQWVKNPPSMQETGVRSLGQEDPLEEGMATHSSILAGKIPWTEEPGGLQFMGYSPGGRQELDTTEATEYTRPPSVVTSHQRCVIPFSASSQQAGHGCSQVRVSAVALEKNSVQSFPLNERGPIN